MKETPELSKELKLAFGIEIVAAMKASLHNWNIEDGRIDALEDTELDRIYLDGKKLDDLSETEQGWVRKRVESERARLHEQALFAGDIAWKWMLEYLQQQQPDDALLTPKEVNDKYQPENIESKMSQFDYCSTARIYSWGLIEGYEAARKDSEATYSLPPLSGKSEEEIPFEELQPIVEKIAYEQLSSDQMGDLVAKMQLLNTFLINRPLSEISDEDIVAVARITRHIHEKWENTSVKVSTMPGLIYKVKYEVLNSDGEVTTSGHVHVRIDDFNYWECREYLKQKGYALPQFFDINHPDNGKTWPEVTQSTK